MIDNYLLKALVAFAKSGTLTKAAAELAVTQPSLTRSMKKLEIELGVVLFDRQPNRISLNETGQFAAKEAEKIIAANQSFSQRVKNFAQSHSKIEIAANAPGPLIVARAAKIPDVVIKPEFIYNGFEKLLADEQFTMLMLNHPLNGAQFSNVYLGTEYLAVNVKPDSTLADKPSLSFKDLAETTFLVALNVGFWGTIFENEIPNGRFIYQERSDEYNELLNHSNFPFFSTNLTTIDRLWGEGLPKDRIEIPITDQIAHQKFYACFLTKHRARLAPLITKLQDTWATVDCFANHENSD